MFVIKRNQVIITALVIMIAVAGYLNYVDRGSLKPQEVALTSEGEVVALVPEGNVNELTASNKGLLLNENLSGDIAFDDNPEIGTTLNDPQQTEAGEAIFVSTSVDSSYFIQAKLEREQSRSRQKEILLELINNTNIVQEKKAEAADGMLTIQQRIEKETATEALLESKGFKDVYVRLDEETVDIVINKEKLSEAEVAQIEDIVKRKTGMKTEQIKISTLKK